MFDYLDEDLDRTALLTASMVWGYRDFRHPESRFGGQFIALAGAGIAIHNFKHAAFTSYFSVVLFLKLQ